VAKFYWTTDGQEKIKQSKIQSMRIGKKVNADILTGKVELEWMVFPIINNKEHNKPVADNMKCEEEAKAWINQHFK